MNNELPSKEDEESKDGKEGSADFHQTSSNEPTVSEIEDERRARRAVFFRSGSRFESPVSAYLKKSGNQLNADEADSEIRNFLVRLAGDRQIEFRTDPVEMAQENDLLLLFGPEEEEEFARLALSFPDETVKRWATLLSGGSRSEAFGPRSRAERRDEATILKEFQTAVLRRLLGGVAVVAILVAGFWGCGFLLEQVQVRSLVQGCVLLNQSLVKRNPI